MLTALAFLGFVTLAIQIRTISAGLPAHPLFVHVPVVLIPLSVLGGLAVAARGDWLTRWGVPFCVCSIVAMSSTFLARQAGSALQEALNLTSQQAHLVHEHSQASDVLTVGFVAFTAILILTFASARISAGMWTGLALADRPLGSPLVYRLLRVLLVILGLVCAYYVYRVGDLGAKAVWLGHLHASGSGAGDGAG